MSSPAFFSFTASKHNAHVSVESRVHCGSVFRALAVAYFTQVMRLGLDTRQLQLDFVVSCHQVLHSHAPVLDGLALTQFKKRFEMAPAADPFINQLARTFFYITLQAGMKQVDQLVWLSEHNTDSYIIQYNALPVMAEALGVRIVCYRTTQEKNIPAQTDYPRFSRNRWTLTIYQTPHGYDAVVPMSKQLHTALLVDEPAYRDPEHMQLFLEHLQVVKQLKLNRYQEEYHRLQTLFDAGTLTDSILETLYTSLLSPLTTFGDLEFPVNHCYPMLLSILARFAAFDPHYRTTLFDQMPADATLLSMTFG